MAEYFLLKGLFRREWIFDSPLREVSFAFEDYLRERQYREGTIHFYLAALAHFAYWMKASRFELSDIDDVLCNRFLKLHLPECVCPSPRQRQSANIQAALTHLRLILREQGLSPVVLNSSPVTDELDQFHHYLTFTCGLAANTCVYCLKIVRSFIQRRFGARQINLALVTVADIDDFFLEYASRWQAASLSVVRTSLKLYFRYRLLQGDKIGESLISMLPIIANWKRTSLPKSLTEEQVGVFLAAFNLSDLSGIRDYAIARCLLDLGLRGNEVAQLRLDSIDWREGTLTIAGAKGRCVKQLPLPWQTGASIVRYLKMARPASKSRSLFLRRTGSIEKPLTVDGIRNAMRRAFVRCGLGDRFCNTHVLRHTCATRLQRSGASLKEIADVLRHRSLDSTTTYARTDVKSLGAMALPWPGRQP
jgi:integrase/recombinase XerD